ncbi:NAD(P)H-hydrate dehydratase [Pseudodesulfovibrio senegalensis]|uniref:Bifunctional NAD(P)H-hydrate repair enzyme n=1 Tax=Pseudodesulfovibrio senegalensis TaxID=1721087 RepID=A0A6N6N187_9BACT|nr:NAD(P)H-hydrate dehydratase [Pseudodesulfovibrio senegalensis]KAB1441142.1 NAD(P)H-hydrate dehydratase [Pseudodesulfovibrio senegalensis]
MFLPLPTPAEMSAWDMETIHGLGIPGMTLMETASREATSVLMEQFEETYGPIAGTEACLFAGPGNNGGDAFAMARHLAEQDVDVTVFHTRPKNRYRGEARSNMLLCKKLGIPLRHADSLFSGPLPQPDIIVDGLLGTGFSGTLREAMLRLIRTINAMGKRAFVLSVDIPSGLNGTTGAAQPDAVRADATATFEAAKIGLMMPKAEEFTGDVFVCPIGIPRQIRDRLAPKRWLMSDSLLRATPRPSPSMHKGSAGHMLVIGGSKGLTGAAHLAALGALRGGAGLVSVACPSGLEESVRCGCPEIMTIPVGKNAQWSTDAASAITDQLYRFDAVVVGPGLGRSGKTVDFLRKIVASCPLPTVLDADALYCLAQDPGLTESLAATTVLTPHPGEMATLTGLTSAAIQDDRLAAAEGFAARCKAVLVLKGAGTIVANSEKTCISPIASPALAVAGSGDILAGLTGALLAQGHAPLQAACLGVYRHAVAGLMLEEKFPFRGNIARDIAAMLPHAIKE